MKKAFTLIEVMVVLSILAIIAILAYNFFGSTSREAKLKQQAAKIYNDLRIIQDAVSLYSTQNAGAYPAGVNINGSHVLVTSGILKSAPVPDQTAVDAQPTYSSYDCWDDMDADGGSNCDGAIALRWVWPDVCREFNKMYSQTLTDGTPHDYAGTSTYSTSDTTYGFWSSGTDYCDIVFVMRDTDNDGDADAY